MQFLSMKKPLVGIIMGSTSDWGTMKHASRVLKDFRVPHESNVVSAHRTPKWMSTYADDAAKRGIQVIIAGAGGAAHLPGMTAAYTHLPVLGVPVRSRSLKGVDSLLSIAQMPAGVPVGTLAIGEAGAKNAALLAIAILALSRSDVRAKLLHFRNNQTQKVRRARLPKQMSSRAKRSNLTYLKSSFNRQIASGARRSPWRALS
jgi:5-(carboxyamino)imidazole ribonucleotide mutase